MVTCHNIIQAFITILFKARHGARDLFPTPISEFCYKREFEWNELADKMFELIIIQDALFVFNLYSMIFFF